MGYTHMYRAGIESIMDDRMSLWNLFDQFLARLEGRKNHERERGRERAMISYD